jgi:hypothetical protein
LGKLFIQSKNRPLYLITEKELDWLVGIDQNILEKFRNTC